jgi:hypothetical protein
MGARVARIRLLRGFGEKSTDVQELLGQLVFGLDRKPVVSEPDSGTAC